MLIKLAGSVLIILAGVVLARAACKYERKRMDVIEGFISLIFFIKGQIDCYALPLSDILQSVPGDILYSCMCKHSAKSIEEIIEAGRIYLDEESVRLLKTFSSEFGSTYREEQLKRCDYFIEALETRRRKISEDAPVRSRIGSALWICSSVTIMILLW